MRTPALALPWLAGALAAGVAAWLLLGDATDSAGTRSGAATAQASGDATSIGPVLRTAGRAPPATTSPSTDAAPPPSRTDAPATWQEVTIVDAAGRALREATIHLDVEGPRGLGASKARTGAQGRARLAWPPGRVVRVRLSVRATTGAYEVVLLRDPGGLDPATLSTLAATSLAWLPVRTVDARGDVRPAQRVLYRPRVPDQEPAGWWGETSDARGECLLGPYALGSTVEVRAGPRGLSAASLAAGGAWAPCRVDGTPVDVVVGDRPRLRLVFPELLPGVAVRLAVLDASTGQAAFPPASHVSGTGPWTAPALAEELVPEVFAGPLADGRWARLTDLHVGEAPLEVRFQDGTFLRGRVAGREAAGALKGQVRAFGRGFEVEAWVAPDGGFTLGGMPDEPVTLVARSIRAADGERPLGGILRREAEQDVALHVAPLVTITGLVVQPDGSSQASGSVVVAAREGLPPEAQPSCHALRGRLWLVVPPGPWRLIVPAGRGAAWADLDLGDVQQDRAGVVLRMRAP